MLINIATSTLLVIDVQEKLLAGIHENESLVKNCSWLIRLAQEVDVPVLGSEQYPKGVGPTTSELQDLLGASAFVAKTLFSCATAPECQQQMDTGERDSFILCGMEAHVCVLHTALELHDQGKKVYVVADAISARNPEDTRLAIERMRQAGITIVSREMVGFEWLRDSSSPHFKTFSSKFLR